MKTDTNASAKIETLQANVSAFEFKDGQTVLACETTKGDGWYEAIVSSKKDNGLYELKWRDYPEYPAFFRPGHDLSPIHPAHKG